MRDGRHDVLYLGCLVYDVGGDTRAADGYAYEGTTRMVTAVVEE